MGALFYAMLAMKLCMVVHAARRGAPFFWFFVIVCVPLGSVLYFALEVLPGLRLPFVERLLHRPVDTATLQYRYRDNPCLENEAALAARLYDEGKPSEAIELYDKALRRDDGYLRAIYGQGLCRRALGDTPGAIESFRRLIERERSYGDYRVWLDLAQGLSEVGEGEKALEVLEGLVRANPRLDYLVALAAALVEAGRQDEARARLEEALEDHRHAPRHVRRFAKVPARQAKQMLGQLA